MSSNRKALMSVYALLPKQEQLRLSRLKETELLTELEKKLAALSTPQQSIIVKVDEVTKAVLAAAYREKKAARIAAEDRERRDRLMKNWQIEVMEALRSSMYRDKVEVEPLSIFNQYPHLWPQGMPECPCPPWLVTSYFPLKKKLGEATGRDFMAPLRPQNEWWDTNDPTAPRNEDGSPIYHENDAILVEIFNAGKSSSKGLPVTPVGHSKKTYRGESLSSPQPLWQTWGETLLNKDLDGNPMYEMGARLAKSKEDNTQLVKVVSPTFTTYEKHDAPRPRLMTVVQGVDSTLKTKVPGQPKLGDLIALKKDLMSNLEQARLMAQNEQRIARGQEQRRISDMKAAMKKQSVMWASEPDAKWLKAQGFPPCPELSAQPWINVHVCVSKGPDGKTQCRYPAGTKATMKKAPDMRVK